MSKKLVWNKEHEKRYNWLFNLLSKSDNKLKNDNYLVNFNKSKLITSINKLELSDSSKESFFFMVARWLEINKPNDSSISTFKKKGYDIKNKRDNKEAENTLDAKETESYQDYNYFLELLNNLKSKEFKSIKQHYEYLILSLLVLQPPVRTNFYITARFSKDVKHDDNTNYIWLTTKGKERIYYIINKDKVSNTRSYKDNTEKSLIELENKQLINIIHESFKTYTRKYLFQNEQREKIKDKNLLN